MESRLPADLRQRLHPQESREAPFGEPTAVAVDPSGNIWVADSAHDHVLQFNSSREFVRQIGSEGSGESQFKGIGGIATNSSGDIYVTDSGNDRVQEFSSSGAHLATFGSSAPGNGQLLSPGAVAVDASGNVWVLNGNGAQEGGRIVEFSASGTFLSQFGSKGTAGGQLLYADGLAFSGGHLYVSEVSPHRVQELSTSGSSSPPLTKRARCRLASPPTRKRATSTSQTSTTSCGSSAPREA